MIADYRRYALMKFKELNINLSDNSAVTRATGLPLDAVKCPEIREEDNASLDSVALFDLTWNHFLLRKIQQPTLESEPGPVTVLFARWDVQSED